MFFNSILNINNKIVKLIYLFKFKPSFFIKLKNIIENVNNY